MNLLGLILKVMRLLFPRMNLGWVHHSLKFQMFLTSFWLNIKRLKYKEHKM